MVSNSLWIVHSYHMQCQLSGAINHFVEIKFDLLTSSVLCTFPSQQTTTNRSCSIAYGPEEQCMVNMMQRSESRGSNLLSLRLTIPLLELLHSQNNLYCFTATASSGTFTTKIEGVFNAGNCTIIYVYMCGMHMSLQDSGAALQ